MALYDEMLGIADRDNLPDDHPMRIRATELKEVTEGKETPTPQRLLGAWARARRAYCDYTGTPLVESCGCRDRGKVNEISIWPRTRRGIMRTLARIDLGGYSPLLLVEFNEDVSMFKDEHGIVHLEERNGKIVIEDQPGEALYRALKQLYE